MYLIRNHHALLPKKLQHAVVTIGNFDGVHLGHQGLLAELNQRARALNRPSGVICFEPQPQEFFAPHPPPRLTSLRQKYQALKQQDIDFMLVLRFNERFALMSAEDFIRQILVKQLHVESLWIGEDFRFGHDRQGDVALLRRMGQQLGYTVEILPDVAINGERVSSTQIRALLHAGQIEEATQLLGRPFALRGKVIPGAARGRTLNMPTANIALKSALMVQGIFVVRVHWGQKNYPGVASLGTRPVFNGQDALLEVHLLDFNGDLYGQMLEVEFLHKLRDEADFASVALLQAQMQHDLLAAKNYWNTQHEQL